MEKNLPILQVSELFAVVNQSLDYAYPEVLVVGEVESFKVNQGKFVFFNLKDGEVSLNCFMMVYQLRLPLEDGMKVMVRARPRLTKWSKFSLNVEAIKPQGEGTIKKSFDKLRLSLEKEGLFDQARKRLLPTRPKVVGVITSTESAGYADFIRLVNQRWGGVEYLVYHTSVQGIEAPDKMIAGLKYFNSLPEPPEVLVLIRGGGSADDLAAYNDELLVRELAASRVPTLVGVGHEVDTTLSDLVADVRAATPSHAAQLLVPDRVEVKQQLARRMDGLSQLVLSLISQRASYVDGLIEQSKASLDNRLSLYQDQLGQLTKILEAYNPTVALKRGYAIVRGTVATGAEVEVETSKYNITAEIKSYESKTN